MYWYLNFFTSPLHLHNNALSSSLKFLLKFLNLFQRLICHSMSLKTKGNNLPPFCAFWYLILI